MESESGSLRSLVTQYVYLHLDLSKPESQSWTKRFPPPGAQIAMPMVNIVTSDGKRVFDNQSERKPINAELLTHYLEYTRRELTPRQIAQIKKAYAAAQEHLKQEDIVKAVKVLAPLLGTRGLGEEVDKLEALGDELAQKARSEMEAAQPLLESPDEAVKGALGLVKVGRIYGKLPALKAEIGALAAKLRADKTLALAFKQAMLLDRADRMPTETDSQRKRAAKAYRVVTRRYRKTPAAELAQAKIDALGGSTASTEGSDPKTTTGEDNDKPVSALDELKRAEAKAYLKLAQTYSRSNRQQARKYANKVIKIAPGSILAEDAKALLKRL